MKIKSLFLSVILFYALSWNGEGGEVSAQNSRLWGTYYGGAGSDDGYSVATDATGNVFLTGRTDSPSPIASGGAQNTIGGGGDGYLVKFDGSGGRLWATYYGGTGDEYGWSVTCDVAGNVYMSGITTSSTNIASGGFQNTYGGGTTDAFLVKYNAGGNLLWATYYGGTKYDNSQSVATDVSGNVYISGRTNSTSGMASGGFQNSYGGGTSDAFVTKFDGTTGNRLWATYYGGIGNDQGYGIASDASGNIYLAGITDGVSGIASGGFQNIYGGAQDVFLVKFDGATGNRLWATYYGGTKYDSGSSVATDASGNVYLAGMTANTTGIASGGFQNTYGGGNNDVFLVKFDGTTGNRLWATYYGGTENEEMVYDGLATDASGNVYLSGDSYSPNTGNVIASGGFQNSLVGIENIFVAKFDASGNRLCATYYGNGPSDEEFGSVAVDKMGNVYMGGITPGPTSSSVASGGFQNTFGGANDASLVKFGLSATAIPANAVCLGQCTGTATVTASGSCALPYTYSWNTLPVQTTQTATGLCIGTYTVIVTDASGAATATTVTIAQVLSAIVTISPNVTITPGTATILTATGGGSYQWSSGEVTQNISVSPIQTTTYCVTVTDSNGCTAKSCVTVVVDIQCGELYIPNAFSPNGDEENDEFCLQGGIEYCIKDLTITIYDRWGESIYMSSDKKFCWDGTYKGKLQNTSVFVYYLDVTTMDGKQITKRGNISLIR